MFYIISRLAFVDKKTTKVIVSKSANKVTVVTGASAGLGLATVRQMYNLKNITDSNFVNNGLVVMACRKLERCNAARDDIMAKDMNKNGGCSSISGNVQTCDAGDPKKAKLVTLELNLSDSRSIRKFVKDLQPILRNHHKSLNTDKKGRQKNHAIDVLINNAGVMGVPQEYNEAGVEKHMQVNHVGHFLLTSLLMPSLMASQYGGRVVNVSSLIAYLWSPFPFTDVDDFDFDLTQKGEYLPIAAYKQSKRSNLLFTHALHQRFHGVNNFSAVAAHPGYSRTSLVLSGMNFLPKFLKHLLAYNPCGSMSAESGSLSIFMAAFDSNRVTSDKFVGPIFGAFGVPITIGTSLQPFPKLEPFSQASVDALWEYSERAIGEKFFKKKQ